MSWPTTTFRDVTLRTRTWNPEKEVRESIQYVDVSAVSRDELQIVSSAHLTRDIPSRARKIVECGDTIFATVRPTLRRVSKVPAELDGEIASTAFCVLRPNRAAIDPDFLFFAAVSDPVLNEVAGLQSGASYPAVRDSDVLDCTIPLPPMGEQKAIAAALTICRNAMVDQHEALRFLDELKRSAIRELFTRGLRGETQKETEFGAVPASWEITDLENHAQVQTGAAKGRKFGDADTIEVPYLRVANVQDGHLDLREMKTIRIRQTEVERYRLQDGDVVLTEGGDFDKLGRGFIWQSELAFCIHQNHVFAVRPDPKVLIPDFFAYLAQSAYGKAYFLKVAHKTTNLACINSAKLKAFPLLIPPTLDEQREITTILQAIDAKIDIHKRKSAVLEELFRALLNKLMTGEIRVTDLDLSALQSNQEVAA